jgi:hypothetical protein
VDTLITDDGLQPEARALVGDRVGKFVIASAADRTHPGPDSTADRIARPDTRPIRPARRRCPVMANR